MGQAAYPTAVDLSSFLTGAGVATGVVAGLDLATAVAAARIAFERASGRVMLAGASATERRFDPPTNRERVVWLGDGGRNGDLASLTSVVYQPEGATAETWTQNTDFELLPENALHASDDPVQPATMLRCTRLWSSPLPLSLRRSLKITGRWGYGLTIPEDAWAAMRYRAASLVLPQVRQASTGGLTRIQMGSSVQEYGRGGWDSLQSGWDAAYQEAVMAYRQVSL